MPKTPSDKLYQLVHALSSSEKRYFKVTAGQQSGKDNKYLRLFEAIDAQEQFDDSALKTAIYGKREIQSRKYSELKAYLYDMILKSLQAYDEKSSVAYRLKHLLLSVRVLFRRSRFDDCKPLLAKARRLAQQYERFNTLLEILEWEKQIAYTEANVDYLNQELERIAAEEKRTLERLQTIVAYRNTFFRLLVLTRKGRMGSTKNGQRLEHLIETPLLKEFSMADSHQAKVLYFRALSIYHFAKSDWPAFYKYSKELVALIESQPDFLKEDVSEYIATVSNLIVSCFTLKKYDEIETLLEKLGSIRALTQDDELKIHRQYYQSKFSLCITTGQFEEGYRALQTHFKRVKRFHQTPFRTNSFYLFYFYISFGAEQYEEALDYLNEWLDLETTIERPYLQGAARLLNLIIHFELGNYELLESLLRSTYRWMKKHDKLHELERLTIGFIKQALEAPSRRELQAAYQSLKAELADRSQQQQTKAFFTQVFDMIAWLDSKMENKTFAEVIRQKYQLSASE
ncbi:MAG TPA: hypothetical protein VJ933_11730 [Phaeodactylibacter sp.]|nr:hypothetical protein [Phaeodactylibacter sp.]